MVRASLYPLPPRILLGAAVLALSLLAGPGSRAAAAPPSYVEGEVILKFKAGAAAADVQAILGDLGATRVRRYRRIKAEHDRITRSVADAVARYRNHPAVEFIEPNYTLRIDAVPNDPLFASQWSLQNIGQQGGTPGADIDAVPAWDTETGSSQVAVAVIDTGVDYLHPDLAPNIFTNAGEIAGNGIDDDQNGFVDDVRGWDFLNLDNDPMDDHGHGTHVAGTIGASGHNGIGIAGVVWNVRILPLKFLSAGGSGPTSAAIECVEYATSMGVVAMNASWGGGGYSEGLRQAIADAETAGVLFVAAAGNSSLNTDLFPNYPSTYDLANIVAVASTDRYDAISGFSNFGVQTVDLAAPGSAILSSFPAANYQVMSGTSMAAPHVTGAIALLRSRYPLMPGASAKMVLLTSSDPLPSLSGLVGSGGRLNVLRMLEGVDSLPPNAVADLGVTATGFDRIALSFTASGDDGAQGTASRYDLRTSTSPIDEANFAAASAASGLPSPGAAGALEHVLVTGLAGNTRYYAALRVLDEYGNASAISNVVTAETTGPPDIAVVPASLEASLETGGSAGLPFVIENSGEGILDVAIEPDFAPESTAVYPASVLAKGEVDPRAGFAGIQGAGGPDLFGYRWADSDAPGGPSFQWEDISTTGTLIPISGDDAISGAIPIGFAFPYYGNSYTQLLVCTNGFLTFDPSTGPVYTNQPLPSTGAPADLIAALWDDLFVGGGTSAVWWKSDGVRMIVQWSNVPHLSGQGPYTFQAVLDRNGTIQFRYQGLGTGLNSPTVGIQNAGRNDGLTMAFNAAYPRAGLAIRISRVPMWISAVPATGSVPSGGSLPIVATVDAAGLYGGDYEAVLRISSNDPDEATVPVPVRLHVTGAPDIAVTPSEVAFGSVFVGGVADRSVTVANVGFETLHVTGVQTDPPAVFSAPGAAFDLAPGTSRTLEVRFAPLVPVAVTGSLTIQSDDPDQGVLTVPLGGEGLVPPDVAVSPDRLDAALLTGGAAERAVTIANDGGSALDWSMTVAGVAGAASVRPYVLAPPPGPLAVPADGAQAGAEAGPARTDSLRASLADLTGTRILFEAGHGSPGPYQWSTLIANLTARGASVGFSDSIVTPERLRDADIVWLPDMYLPWLPSERAALLDWVRLGGSLLMEGDNFATVPVYNGILATLGVPVSYAAAPGADGPTTRIHAHPTTQDVHSILLSANLARLSPADASVQVLVDDASGVPNSAAAAAGAGRVLLLADEVFDDFHTGYGDNQLFANQAFDWLSGVRWVSVTPTSGTTPAGGSTTVTAHFDATGLATGTYRATLLTRSNDPDEPEAPVDVELAVTGAPDVRVSPQALAFGPLFVGESRIDSVSVSNIGTDDLHVASIGIDHPDFTADASFFALPPGASRQVRVTYTPQALGPIAATLTIACDDPDRPSTAVALSALSLPPPDVDVAPASFQEALDTGQSVVREMSVFNLSGSPLEFSIRVVETTGGAGAPSGPGALAATTEPWSAYRERALSDSSRGAAPPSVASGLALPVVITDPAGDGGPVDLRYLRASRGGGVLEIELETLAPIQGSNFGGCVSLDTDQNRFTGRAPSFGNAGQDIGAEYEFFLFSLSFGYVELYDAITGSFRGSFPAQVQGNTVRFAAPLSALGNDDGVMDVTGVIGTASGPTDWFPDSGHGTIGRNWLAVSPDGGTVEAGGAEPIAVTFDATGADGGDYTADIVVSTNDPDERVIRVPAALHVTGVPVISVEPAALVFDSLFVGLTSFQEIVVGNVGSAPLTVSQTAIDSPEFTADASSFILGPRATRRVRVTFAPQSAGSKAASLGLTHDAAGSPSVVALSGVGVAPPVITVDPTAIAASAETGQQVVQPLHVRNAGGSDLRYGVQLLEGAAGVTVHEALEVPRGEPDPRAGTPVTQGSGGPDLFGYRWIDSDQPGGPVFDWVEIRDVGTRIPMRNLDENFGPIPIGFAFPFYGRTFTELHACTHGWLSFTSSAVQWSNQPLPSPGAPENLLAAFWEDQNFSGTERAYYHNDGSRLIVEYVGVPGTSGGGPYTYEVILYPNGTIVYQYLEMGPPTNGATIGIQNGTRDDGLTVAFNATYVRDRLAIRFASAPAWLRVEPSFGSVPPAGEAALQVTADAAGLFPGDYAGRVEIQSNDPLRPIVTVPASLHVFGIPDLAVTPASLVFDSLYIGRSQSRELRLTNMGTDVLEITGVAFGLPDFSADVTALTLAPLQSRVVTVTFAAGVAGDRSADLTIASNDPDSPQHVPIHAVALVPPALSITQVSLTAAAAPDGFKMKTLRLCNTGGSDLLWRATPVMAAGLLPPHPILETAKGEVDPRAGILGSGGPDAYGHVWTDSDSPGGPPFDWIDIGGIGTVVPFSAGADDQNLGPYPIGFSFPFYGSVFEEFRVCTNGWISFTSASPTFTNQPLPSAGAPENLVAALWDDLIFDPTVNSRVLYWSEEGRLIVQYENLRPFGIFSATLYTFQIELRSSGEILYRYLSLGSVLTASTIGIQNEGKDDGLTVAFNTTYLHPGLAVRFAASARWLTLTPAEGVISAGGCSDVTARFDAAGLDAADYAGTFHLETNEPDSPPHAEACLFHVGTTGAVAADIEPNTLNLDSRGRWVVGRVELPASLDPGRVLLPTVSLQGSVPAESLAVGDFNENGIPDLEIRFRRDLVEAILPEGEMVPLVITGEVEDLTVFVARDTIRAIRPKITAPNGGEVWLAGGVAQVTWQNPQGWDVVHATLFYSRDGGESWALLQDHVAGTAYSWTLPALSSGNVLVRVYVSDAEGVMGFDTSDAPFAVLNSITGVETLDSAPPAAHELYANSPNPFNPRTVIRFDLPAPGSVRLRVFDASGRLVRTLVRESLPAGRHRVAWDGEDDRGNGAASGVYFYRIEVTGAARYEKSRRMILLR